MAIRSLPKLFAKCLAALGVLFVIVTLTPLAGWWTAALTGPTDNQPADVLVVLSGSSMQDGLIGQSAFWRATFGARDYWIHPYRRVIFTGGGASDPPIAELMKRAAVASGVPEDRTETEVRSTSTRENVQFTASLLRGEPGPIAVVTSDYHMFRTARLFAKAGIPILRRPHADAAARSRNWDARWEVAYELAVESVKIAYYKVRGWI